MNNFANINHYINGDRMKENINALDEIHKGACMGQDAINFVLEKVSSDKLKSELESEYQEYDKIAKRIDEVYNNYDDGEPHSTSAMNKAMTWSGIEMKTMMAAGFLTD